MYIKEANIIDKGESINILWSDLNKPIEYYSEFLFSNSTKSKKKEKNIKLWNSKDIKNQIYIKYEDVIGKGAKKYKSFNQVPIKDATNYSAEDADITLQLYEKLIEIIDKSSIKLLKTIDYPLLFVLLEMEQKGALIDTSHLNGLSKEFGTKLLNLVKKIHEASGSVFNIDSPKQLSEILFEKLKIETKGLKKTSTGYFSTSESVLQKLSDENEIVKDILEYRSLAKLKSTNTDKISEICDQNSRVHTSYHQAVTSTGRLSSSDPNLQNIPIRTKEGITIREAFIAPSSKKILAMDYYQIELRLMAHYSQDPIMLKSFKNNEDILRRTASEFFGVDSIEWLSPDDYEDFVNCSYCFGGKCDNSKMFKTKFL